MANMSGITLNEQCVPEYNLMKMSNKKSKCIIYMIKENSEKKMEFVVKEVIPKDTECDHKTQYLKIVQEHLLKDDLVMKVDEGDKGVKNQRNPCVVVWDWKLERGDTKAGVEKDVMLFMTICPDDIISVKKKMIFASSVESFKKSLQGIKAVAKITDLSDLEYERVQDLIVFT